MRASKIPSTIFFPLLSLVAALASGCENNDIRDWRAQTLGLRQRAVEQIAHTPYRQDQHQAFKSYFSSLSTMALSLARDAGKRQRFNEAVRRSDASTLCQELFMAEPPWRRLMGNCIKNRFFLCAEEVRAYPTLLRALRGALSADLARRFDQSCEVMGELHDMDHL